MKALYDVAAPAKLNLFLHITGRRGDGYHLLESVFMLIDWCDVLHFELRRDGQISREDLGAALPPDDLTMRAARALQAHAATPLGVHMGVHKQIPVQAGMGGGSSDAASCLLTLNRLWNIGLTLSQLEHVGLQLGADVPFFLRGRNAWVQGIGEDITPLTDELQLPAARFAVLKPQAGLETRRIFKAGDLKRDTQTAIISGFAANPFGFGVNDLQPVAQRLCPEVTQALEWLSAQGLQGRMTGSGSAVFARMLHETDLQPPAQVPAGWHMRACGNLAVHPLVGWAASDD